MLDLLAPVLDIVSRVLATEPVPPLSVVIGTGVVALLIVMWRRAWRVARNLITIAHEGGHAAAAVLTGRRLQGIRLHSDTSGLTLSKGRRTGPGMVITLAAGYTAPSLLGVGGAALLASGRFTLLLWLAIVLALLMLVMIRNVYGVLSIVVTGGGLFAVSWFAPPNWQALVAYLAVWFLLLGGVRPVFEMQKQRRQGRARSSDADQLAGVTRVAAGLWVFFFLLVCAGSLLAGGLLLGVLTAPPSWTF